MIFSFRSNVGCLKLRMLLLPLLLTANLLVCNKIDVVIINSTVKLQRFERRESWLNTDDAHLWTSTVKTTSITSVSMNLNCRVIKMLVIVESWPSWSVGQLLYCGQRSAKFLDQITSSFMFIEGINLLICANKLLRTMWTLSFTFFSEILVQRT